MWSEKASPRRWHLSVASVKQSHFKEGREWAGPEDFNRNRSMNGTAGWLLFRPLTSSLLHIPDSFFFLCKWDSASSATGWGRGHFQLHEHSDFVPKFPRIDANFPRHSSVQNRLLAPCFLHIKAPRNLVSCSLSDSFCPLLTLLHLPRPPSLALSLLLTSGLFSNTQSCSSFCLEQFSSKNSLDFLPSLLQAITQISVSPRGLPWDSVENYSSLVFFCTFPLSTYQHHIYHIFLLFCLLYVSLSPEFRLFETLWDFCLFHSLLYCQLLEQCLTHSKGFMYIWWLNGCMARGTG